MRRVEGSREAREVAVSVGQVRGEGSLLSVDRR